MYERHRNGKLSEFFVAYKLTEMGYDVYFPTGNPKYDIIAERDGHRNFIQVKSGLRNGETLKINLRGNSDTQRYSPSEVDVFAIHERSDDEVYFVPISEVNGQISVCLRYADPPSIKSHRTRFAKDYTEFPLKEAN